ncbi:MAG: PEP-CTERM system histidine kinase PrsK [Mitsuaria chitosanitabida]|uniref:XrtA/PEP-CTERM system histidine kinase PrsK n=1 Tax=Roseateles chitosanitabidus TaxID=65048 RepID=UPI001B2DA122|nr:XrtA/PEP-CTERM system histidine kinase PrsK [Roseateles chitosanitabidus]MBO9685704.1 PEP-CTERM system histidine kinase PrsK [Roseateles chitosanitabidus]
MWHDSLSLGTASGIVAVVAHLALAVAVLPQFGQQRRRALRLEAALLLTALWAALDAAVEQGWLGHQQWPAQLLLPLCDVLRYGAWFAFILSLIEPRADDLAAGGGHAATGVARPLQGLAGAGVAATVALTVWHYVGSQPFSEQQRPMTLAWLGLAVFGLVLLEQMLRNIHVDARWNAKPVCLGLGAVFAFDVFVYSQASLFQQFDGDALSVRAAVHSLAVPLLWLASRRHKKWLDKLHVSRTAAFHSATLLIVGVYLLGVSGIGYYVRYTGGEWGRALQQVLLAVGVLALLLMGLSGSLRAKLRVYISKHFFSYRYDYRQEWLRFTAMLSASASPAELGESVIRGLAHLVESPSGALWLRRGGGSEDYQQAARWNLGDDRDPVTPDAAMLHLLRDRAWIVDLDEWRRRPEAYERIALPEAVAGDARHWLLVPLLNAGVLTGWVILGQPRTRMEVNWEVRDLLRTAAQQAASYLAQMQAAEALLEARKFEAFNRMSAFVVHDLKNIVTQLSLMMKNAKRLRDNPEFQQDMLDTVENSLEKMRQLMLQLREGDKPHHGSAGGVALTAIARRLAAAAVSKGRALELELRDEVSARGHEERIERVLGHVVQNALDATPIDGRVSLRLQRTGSNAQVEVEDTGCGMTQEFMDQRLFKPFQTTKAAGMGIGAYESYQYLQELGGKINVESAPGRGTKVTILLPLFFAQSGSDAGLVEIR